MVGCGLAFDEKPNGDRAGGMRGKLCVAGQLCSSCKSLYLGDDVYQEKAE